MKNPWCTVGIRRLSSLPTQTTPQFPLPRFPHCAVDIKLEPEGSGAVGLECITVTISKAIFFLLFARVACMKVKMKPVRGVGAGRSTACFVWRSRLAVASAAENIGSGHACLRSNPITPCGWAPKIAPVSLIITVQRSHYRPLIVPGTQSSLTPPLPAGWATCSEPTFGDIVFSSSPFIITGRSEGAEVDTVLHASCILTHTFSCPARLAFPLHLMEVQSQAQGGEGTCSRSSSHCMAQLRFRQGCVIVPTNTALQTPLEPSSQPPWLTHPGLEA